MKLGEHQGSLWTKAGGEGFKAELQHLSQDELVELVQGLVEQTRSLSLLVRSLRQKSQGEPSTDSETEAILERLTQLEKSQQERLQNVSILRTEAEVLKRDVRELSQIRNRLEAKLKRQDEEIKGVESLRQENASLRREAANRKTIEGKLTEAQKNAGEAQELHGLLTKRREEIGELMEERRIARIGVGIMTLIALGAVGTHFIKRGFKPVEQYCASDTVKGQFIKPDGTPFTQFTGNQTIVGVRKKTKPNSGGFNGKQVVSFIPQKKPGMQKAVGECVLEEGKLPKLLAAHDLSLGSGQAVEIADEMGHRDYLHFRHKGYRKNLFYGGELPHAATTAKKGESLAITVNGIPVISELVESDGNVNIGFLHAAEWMQNRGVVKKGYAIVNVTKTPELQDMQRVTMSADEWVTDREEILGRQWEELQAKKGKAPKQPWYLFGVGVAAGVGILLGLRAAWKNRPRINKPSTRKGGAARKKRR